MITVYQLMGAPGSGKSFWAKNKIAEDPLHSIRLNNDDFRSTFNNSEYSPEYENLVSATRLFLIREALKRDFKHIFIDNVNVDPKHWKDICKFCAEINKDVTVQEIPFYISLEEAIKRDSLREGKARVGEEVIKRFWKKLGGEQFQFYKPRIEVFHKRDKVSERIIEPMKQNTEAPKAIMCDLDGSVADCSHRSPYDTAKCLDDKPIQHVINAVKLFHQNEHKVIFVSGREDKFRDLTEQWLNTHIGVEHELFMRPTSNFEKDSIIKERIFNNHIKDKYCIKAIFDDRLQVCEMWHKLGLPLFRVNDPTSSF